MADSQIPKGTTIGELIDQRRITYLLPVALVEQIHSKYGDQFFSKSELAFELSELERRLFVESNAIGARVRGNTPLQEPLDLDFEFVFEELNIQFIIGSDSEAKNQISKLTTFTLAYCGWLVQQAEYWKDIEAFKIAFRGELFKSGLPRQPDFRFESLDELDQENPDLACETRKLCNKWRIADFATIEMPVPLQPTILSREFYPSPLREGLIVYAMPDIYPFSGRGEVVEDLEVQRAYTEAPHLEEWFKMACSASRSKKRFVPLARQFQAQHFWRVLLSRHGQKIKGKKTKLQELLGESLGVDRETIKTDFRTFRKLPFSLLECPLELYF